MNRPHLRSAIEKRARMRLISGQFRKQRKKVAAPLRRGVFMVPATITSIGLLSGFYSLISSVDAHFEFAAVLIMVAFVCDGLDGRVARLSRTSSQFGVEYDSLSDIVAFGVAPAGLAYSWALRPLGAVAIVISGLFVVSAGLRLARFNVQTGTTDKRRFTGLPVPGAAAMIAGIVLAYSYFELNSPRALCVVAMLLAMPQFTLFMLATAYVLSGPFLIVRGEGMTAKVPVLHPVESDAAHPQPAPDSHDTTL